VNSIQTLYQGLISFLKKLPTSPGVYLYKNDDDEVMYIGKAKNLKKRGAQYIQSLGRDVKTDTIFQLSTHVDFVITETELEALFLEAHLINTHKPCCNVLLKTGQPFVYLFIPSQGSLPELEIVRNQKFKGSYFGPFLEKGAARRVFTFLIKTFRLRLCNKKISNGCIYYHMGQCAGSCRDDFDKSAYLDRLELAKKSLRQGHRKFLTDLAAQIRVCNEKMEFEKSRELHRYFLAFESVFEALESRRLGLEQAGHKHIWVLANDQSSLWVFDERDGVLKKKHAFFFPLADGDVSSDILDEHFLGFYRVYAPVQTILINFELAQAIDDYQTFLQEWHTKETQISIVQPKQGHFASLMRLAQVHVQQDLEKQATLARSLKLLLKLPHEPRTIDCFDISHKQGTFMVGSCVRFKDGKPDKENVRRFHIKTVHQIDDYASLREIVGRRYRDAKNIPDLIMIDGGKGQLNAVIDLFPGAHFISLAKREETVFSKNLPAEGKRLDQKTYAAQALIALRDYAHHFAISFHRSIETLEDE
jgi:excinuclease ABC subunit C